MGLLSELGTQPKSIVLSLPSSFPPADSERGGEVLYTSGENITATFNIYFHSTLAYQDHVESGRLSIIFYA